MVLFYLSISITVISNVFYHIVIKLTPEDTNPAVALSVTYGTSLLICLIYLLIFPPDEGFKAAFAKTNWTSAALGLAILGLEFGYLLAYRAGWNISMAGIVSSAVVGIILIPIGLFIFKEKLNFYNLTGIIFCIIGLVLVNLKS